MESETAVIEYRVGGEPNTVRKLPGLTKYANIVLRRGMTQNAELWSWREHCSTPSPATSHARGPPRVAVNVEYERPGEPRCATKVTHDLELLCQLAYRV